MFLQVLCSLLLVRGPLPHQRERHLYSRKRGVRTGSWTVPPRGKWAPRVGISSTVFGVRAHGLRRGAVSKDRDQHGRDGRQGLGFGVQGRGFRVWGSGFRV